MISYLLSYLLHHDIFFPTNHHSLWDILCVKSARIWSYSGLCFPAFGLNTNQNISEYRHPLCSEDWLHDGI